MITNEWDELAEQEDQSRYPLPDGTLRKEAGAGYVNGYQLCNSYVKPWTRGTGCSVSLLMNATPLLAEVMISHGEFSFAGLLLLIDACVCSLE